MPNSPTPILDLIVPLVGGDNNQWGTELNADLAIIDNLGAAPVTAVSGDYSASSGAFPESIFLVTTGASDLAFALPVAASCLGKIFTVKKVDAGVGSVTITPATGTIDGNGSWIIDSQYSFIRAVCDGTNYDVIGLL